MRLNVLITGGGTGGHVYPALAIIRHLQAWRIGRLPEGSPHVIQAPAAPHTADELQLGYIGSSRGVERTLVPAAGIPYFLFPMAPPNSLRGLLLLTLALLRSILLVLRARPLVTFATGGYVSLPAVLASRLLRVPIVLFLPDAVPGRAVFWLAPLAQAIAVSCDAALDSLPARKVVVTGYPVRESFVGTSRERGRARFALPQDAMVLCVAGGSQGSRSINEALAPCLPRLLTCCHVLHICGPQRWEEAREAAASLSPELADRYRLYPYLHDVEMADALAAADLVLCRSGASVLGELPMTGTPGVLVPYPNPRVHQRENAEYLARHGAAVVLRDEELSERLGPVLEALLADSAALARMGAACRLLARSGAARDIAAMVRQVALRQGVVGMRP